MKQWSRAAWKQAVVVIEDYEKGVRFIRFEHQGNDLQNWAGHYGSKMTISSVRLQMPKTTITLHSVTYIYLAPRISMIQQTRFNISETKLLACRSERAVLMRASAKPTYLSAAAGFRQNLSKRVANAPDLYRPTDHRVNTLIDNIICSPDDVRKNLLLIQPDAAAGPDGVPARVERSASNILASTTLAFNLTSKKFRSTFGLWTNLYVSIVTDNGGDMWAIELPFNGCKSLPEKALLENGIAVGKDVGCFATSFGYCVKHQMIKLEDFGVSTKLMDELRPTVEVSEWYAPRFDCASYYRIFVDTETKVFSCRQVCKFWLEVLDNEISRKQKDESINQPIPWFCYYECETNPFGKNLLLNTFGKDGFRNWEVTENRGHRWAIELPFQGCKKLPEEALLENSVKNFSPDYASPQRKAEVVFSYSRAGV
ncbi:hypothetical protein B566_EDAN012618 [Ephemera danica]|nr:hypothetical protein B566_EDAN012618 [Ephemera danica]